MQIQNASSWYRDYEEKKVEGLKNDKGLSKVFGNLVMDEMKVKKKVDRINGVWLY